MIKHNRLFLYFLIFFILLKLDNPMLFLAFPSSTSYQLKSYEFGSGGATGDTSTTYSMEAITGEVTGARANSTTYTNLPGLNYVQMANTPSAPTVDNGSSTYYNKLHFVVNKTASDPTDATYIIAVSTDNFVTDTTHFIQADDTIGTTQVAQTYTNWSGATGENLLGLTPGTTYSFKVKSSQGKYTESPYSAVASVATVNVTLFFDIDVAATDVDNSVTNLDVGNLTAGSVTTASQKIWIDLTTNASNGGVVYVRDSNSGLTSAKTGTTISSATADLTSAGTGYGLQGSTKTQTSGGPLTYITPYDGTVNSVGLLDTTLRRIFDSSGAAISGGRGSANVKIKVSTTTPASTDYTDTITLVAAGNF